MESFNIWNVAAWSSVLLTAEYLKASVAVKASYEKLPGLSPVSLRVSSFDQSAVTGLGGTESPVALHLWNMI